MLSGIAVVCVFQTAMLPALGNTQRTSIGFEIGPAWPNPPPPDGNRPRPMSCHEKFLSHARVAVLVVEVISQGNDSTRRVVIAARGIPGSDAAARLISDDARHPGASPERPALIRAQ